MSTLQGLQNYKGVPKLGTGDAYIWWKLLIQHTNHIVILTDCDGEFIFANKKAQQFLSGPRVNLIGKTWGDLLPPKVADEHLMYARATHKTNKPIELIGIVKGICQCTMFCPVILDDTDVPKILVVCHTLTALDHPLGQRKDRGIRSEIAEFNDLGHLSILSERELEVLACIGEGCSPPETAKRLHRSVKTIEWHRRSLGRKLGVNNTLQLMRIAIRAGLNHVGLLDKRFRFDYTTYTAVSVPDSLL